MENLFIYYSCVPGNKCGGNKVVRRSSGLDGLEVAAADEAICPNDSDICCSEDEIDRECSDYSPDGYKCVQNCFDLPQDEPSESEQLSNISPFLPKEAKCPKGELCCKRLEKPNLTEEPNLTVCEDQPGFKCTDFDLCDPNTFLAKPVDSVEDKIFQNINLIDSNLFGGITVNTAKSPCKNPTQVCCKPIETKMMKRGPMQPLPPVKCGIHNQFGLKRGGVGVSYTYSNGKPVTSQEGEWPHTCLILKIENEGLQERLVGGASLIAPKVVVTAAHIIKYVLATKKPLIHHFTFFGV